jgi:hypothetical protein
VMAISLRNDSGAWSKMVSIISMMASKLWDAHLDKSSNGYCWY